MVAVFVLTAACATGYFVGKNSTVGENCKIGKNSKKSKKYLK